MMKKTNPVDSWPPVIKQLYGQMEYGDAATVSVLRGVFGPPTPEINTVALRESRSNVDFPFYGRDRNIDRVNVQAIAAAPGLPLRPTGVHVQQQQVKPIKGYRFDPLQGRKVPIYG